MAEWVVVALALAALWRWWVLDRRLQALLASQHAREKAAWVALGAGLTRP